MTACCRRASTRITLDEFSCVASHSACAAVPACCGPSSRMLFRFVHRRDALGPDERLSPPPLAPSHGRSGRLGVYSETSDLCTPPGRPGHLTLSFFIVSKHNTGLAQNQEPSRAREILAAHAAAPPLPLACPRNARNENWRAALLERGDGAGVLKLLLEALALLLAAGLLDGLGRRLDQLLRLLEAQAGDGAHHLRSNGRRGRGGVSETGGRKGV